MTPRGQDTPGRPPSPLRQRRLKQGMRLKDVAELADVSISTVSTVESGYVPPIRTQQQIAQAVGASAGSFWPNGNGAS